MPKYFIFLSFLVFRFIYSIDCHKYFKEDTYDDNKILILMPKLGSQIAHYQDNIGNYNNFYPVYVDHITSDDYYYFSIFQYNINEKKYIYHVMNIPLYDSLFCDYNKTTKVITLFYQGERYYFHSLNDIYLVQKRRKLPEDKKYMIKSILQKQSAFVDTLEKNFLSYELESYEKINFETLFDRFYSKIIQLSELPNFRSFDLKSFKIIRMELFLIELRSSSDLLIHKDPVRLYKIDLFPESSAFSELSEETIIKKLEHLIQEEKKKIEKLDKPRLRRTMSQ